MSDWDNQLDSLQHLFLKQNAACYDFYRSHAILTGKTNVEYKTYVYWAHSQLIHLEDKIWFRIFDDVFDLIPTLRQKWNEILITKRKFEEKGGVYPVFKKELS